MVNPLSRVAMQNIIKDKSPIISARVTNNRNSSNLDNSENEMILGVISGEREVVEKQNTNRTISLDEFADKIKNNR